MSESAPVRPADSQGGGSRFESLITRVFVPVAGLVALMWMLIRVIPKPSRAQYPCMKVAAPLAGGFVAYVAGMAIALYSLKRAGRLFRESRYLFGVALVLGGVFVGLFTVLESSDQSYADGGIVGDSLFVPTEPPNTPMGTARGIFPGRVVWMWDSTATTWTGAPGTYWHDDKYTHPVVVDSMLSRSLRSLSGKASDVAAWDTLFKFFNIKHGKGAVGYQPGEKIAIKINLVQSSGAYNVGNACFASPQLMVSLLNQLVNKAGVKDSNITIYDTDRYVPDPIYTKCHSAFPGVHYMGWVAQGGREKYVRDTVSIHWSESLTQEINGGNTAYLPTVVTKASYLINLGSFKAHRYMGVTFCSKNHFGTLSCDTAGIPYQNAPHAAGLHFYTAVHTIDYGVGNEWTFHGRPMGSYNTLVDLMGHKDLGAKTLLFMIDGLYAVETEGSPVSTQSKWRSAPFNKNWTASLFLSQDNIAIESVGLDFFNAEQHYRIEQKIDTIYHCTYGAVDNYLHEGAQADNPPSGTFYHPAGETARLQSLGVHEHWNNAVAKQYSRNLSPSGTGIELVALKNAITSVPVPEGRVPAGFALYENYPNPFNPSTTIGFTIPQSGNLTLVVYDGTGREVRTLANGSVAAGYHAVRWDGKDNRGSSVSSGIYFYRLRVGSFVETKKMAFTK